MQYFYDQAKSELVVQDIQTPSERYVMAVGTIQESKGGHKPVSVVTSDGGAHWDVGETGGEPGLAVLSQ